MRYRLLEKTELWIEPLRLVHADLDACARAAGGVLGLEADQIMVTDAQENHLVFDVLSPTVEASSIVARQEALLAALGQVPGVEVDDQTQVHSDGILGLISLGTEEGRLVLERSEQVRQQLADRIARRAKILSTGEELIQGQVEDTNTPYLRRELEALGFTVATAGPLADQLGRIAHAMRQAAEQGYGLIVTTGGVGAEAKDQTVEALLMLAPDASTPYVLKFTQGQGRHAKDGVRLGVGRYEKSIIVTLPGPHDEVLIAWPILAQALKESWTPERIADHLADALRQKFINHQPHHQH